MGQGSLWTERWQGARDAGLATARRAFAAARDHVLQRGLMLGEVVVAVAILVGGYQLGRGIERRRHEAEDEALVAQYRHQVQLNDSTSVLLAGERARSVELTGLLRAARQLNGTLVAAARLTIAQDSVRRSLALTSDSAHGRPNFWPFRDSTKVGVLSGGFTVTDKGRMDYTFAPNAISPSVGFVRVGSKYVAVVTCSLCDTTVIEAPFVDGAGLVAKSRRWGREALVGWDPATGRWTAGIGVTVRLGFGVSLAAEARQTFVPGETPKALLGVRKSF